ncbi:hypothetical protein K8942_02645 [Candidatus Peribacteria bacterium]|nr:MAG: hypothetical protein K8942_02645 [Candidatus Peribacteria bacterium]
MNTAPDNTNDTQEDSPESDVFQQLIKHKPADPHASLLKILNDEHDQILAYSKLEVSYAHIG